MHEVEMTVRFPEKRQLVEFINMLSWMEMCGNIGHSTEFVISMDGDGDARPKFIFEDDEVQEAYNKLRRFHEKETFPSTPKGGSASQLDIRFSIS